MRLPILGHPPRYRDFRDRRTRYDSLLGLESLNGTHLLLGDGDLFRDDSSCFSPSLRRCIRPNNNGWRMRTGRALVHEHGASPLQTQSLPLKREVRQVTSGVRWCLTHIHRQSKNSLIPYPVCGKRAGLITKHSAEAKIPNAHSQMSAFLNEYQRRPSPCTTLW